MLKMFFHYLIIISCSFSAIYIIYDCQKIFYFNDKKYTNFIDK